MSPGSLILSLQRVAPNAPPSVVWAELSDSLPRNKFIPWQKWARCGRSNVRLPRWAHKRHNDFLPLSGHSPPGQATCRHQDTQVSLETQKLLSSLLPLLISPTKHGSGPERSVVGMKGWCWVTTEGRPDAAMQRRRAQTLQCRHHLSSAASPSFWSFLRSSVKRGVTTAPWETLWGD